MKSILTISTLCLGIMGSAYANTTPTHPIPISQAEQIATEAVDKLFMQDPSISFFKEKQTIINKLEHPAPNGICCKASYDGKTVQGNMVASHGHGVCVPFMACG